jgi:hypothetical protein
MVIFWSNIFGYGQKKRVLCELIMLFLYKKLVFYPLLWPFARFSNEKWARKNNDFSGVCGLFAHFPTFIFNYYE